MFTLIIASLDRKHNCMVALNTIITTAEHHVYRLMAKHALTMLRLSLGIVFVWFGLLKPFQASPAEQLVRETTAMLMAPAWFVSFLGFWEVAIGVCICFRATTRVALLLLFLHMPGTMLPLVLLPEVCWTHFPYGLTMEGQYIIKNLVLVSGAMIIGGTLHYHSAQQESQAQTSDHLNHQCSPCAEGEPQALSLQV